MTTQQLDRLYEALRAPLAPRARVALALLVLPLVGALLLPLWEISMTAPQYPDGLTLQIFAHTIRGDINEINTLNHYIGMAAIDRAALSDLDWLPLMLGALALFALRCAAVGTLTSALDLLVLFTYFGAFSSARFVYKLWVFGHHLDPAAPFKMEPFTPAIVGSKVIANFTTHSWPASGSLLLAVFGTGVLAVFALNLHTEWRRGGR